MKRAIITVLAVLAISGTALAGGKFKADVKTPAARVNAKASVSVHIEGASGYHFNIDYPARLTITAPSGVTVEKDKLTAKDAVKFAKDGADFAVNFTATTPGKKSFTGELKFAVCTENDCAPQTEKLAFDVDVK